MSCATQQVGEPEALGLLLQVKDQCGRGALAKSLNKVLVEHIRASLPNLRARLEEALEKTNTELKAYGDAPPGQTTAARWATAIVILFLSFSRGHMPCLNVGK